MPSISFSFPNGKEMPISLVIAELCNAGALKNGFDTIFDSAEGHHTAEALGANTFLKDKTPADIDSMYLVFSPAFLC